MIVRYANQEDTPQIMQYIDRCWKKAHILARNLSFFNWQYTYKDCVNFVIGIEDSEIRGVLGFIPYLNVEDENRTIALALWKADATKSLLGMKLLSYLMSNEKNANIICTGINMNTTSLIYRTFGFSISKMTQWYRLSSVISEYTIADIKDYTIPETFEKSGYCFEEIESITHFQQEFDLQSEIYRKQKPFKSCEYLQWRYFEHPMYDYHIYGLRKSNEKIKLVLVFRIQEYGESKALRLIDCIGDYSQLVYATAVIDDYMSAAGVEYVDVYETGMNDDIWKKAGWLKVYDTDNIIPNYFFPFEQRNIDIYCCSNECGVVLFKGDGDQDRPN